MGTRTQHGPKPGFGNTYFGLADLIDVNRNTRPVDPNTDALEPREIEFKQLGPFHCSHNCIICDRCGSFIRENYLPAHRSNGACDRNIQKQILAKDLNPSNPRIAGLTG